MTLLRIQRDDSFFPASNFVFLTNEVRLGWNGMAVLQEREGANAHDRVLTWPTKGVGFRTVKIPHRVRMWKESLHGRAATA